MRLLISQINTFIAHHFRIDAHYFFSGAVWLTIIQAITVLGALIVSVVFANVLDETQYGVYRYILSIGALLTSFSLTGMGQSIFQTAAQGHKAFYHKGVRKGLLYSVGITAAGVIGSLYYYFQDNIELAIGCLLIAIFQPLLNTFQQIFPFLQGERHFKESTIVQGIKTLIVTGVSVTTVYTTQNVLLLVFAYLISNTLTNLVIHYIYKPQDGLTDASVLDRYMAYAKNTSVRNLIGNIAFRIDSIVVFQQLGAANLAIYTIANILPEHIKASFKNIITLLVPKYAQRENLEVIKKGMFKRSIQLFFIFLLITVIYIIFSPFVYAFLFPKYEEAIFLSQILALSFPAMIALVPVSALQAHTKEVKLNQLNTVTSILMIICTVFLTVFYGIMGAIAARVATRYINLFFGYYFFLKKDN